MNDSLLDLARLRARGVARSASAAAGRARKDVGRLLAGRTTRRASPLSSPYPYEPIFARLRPELLSPPLRATGVTRESYLEMAGGIVDFFTRHQAAGGAILDPVAGCEKQYATPCYALAAAYLVKSGLRPDLEGAAARALDHSLLALARMNPADAHGDFFTFPAVLAHDVLRETAPRHRAVRWRQLLREVRPARAYSDVYKPRRQTLFNWNAIAVCGEFLRHRRGFTDDAFVEYYLREQLEHFTPAGMYLDAGGPMIYDHFPRYFWVLMLHQGYRGAQASCVEELLDRGERTSLLMQSPCGEMPTGGRSKQHQWGDAMQCATFEVWARRKLEQGDAVLARAFKRGAHLALAALRPWVRPTGDLFIVKNRSEPEKRHGFEAYSWHSTYNLLAASMLAVAWDVADDAIPEGNTPAEVGGFAFEVPEFHKVFGNHAGHYVQLDTSADPLYESTGLVRIHQRGTSPLLGPSDSGACVEGEPWWDGTEWRAEVAPGTVPRPSSLGVAWWSGTQWASLGELPTGATVGASLHAVERTDERIRFEVVYSVSGSGVCEQVSESYDITAEVLTVSVSAKGPVERLRVCFPVFASDGREDSAIAVDGNAVRVRFAGHAREFRVVAPEGAELACPEERIPSRNGFLRRATAEVAGSRVTYESRAIAYS